jgi:hypothetical protein
MTMVPAAFAISICVIHKEGLCPSNGDMWSCDDDRHVCSASSGQWTKRLFSIAMIYAFEYVSNIANMYLTLCSAARRAKAGSGTVRCRVGRVYLSSHSHFNIFSTPSTVLHQWKCILRVETHQLRGYTIYSTKKNLKHQITVTANERCEWMNFLCSFCMDKCVGQWPKWISTAAVIRKGQITARMVAIDSEVKIRSV